jgi:hypothetical protein
MREIATVIASIVLIALLVLRMIEESQPISKETSRKANLDARRNDVART